MALTIERDDDVAFRGSTSTAATVRSCEELVGWLTRHDDVDELAVWLTWTAIVPSEDFTLRQGERVTIDIEAIGTLENPATVVRAFPVRHPLSAVRRGRIREEGGGVFRDADCASKRDVNLHLHRTPHGSGQVQLRRW